jgi:putative flavoprotein involved in K+ transport
MSRPNTDDRHPPSFKEPIVTIPSGSYALPHDSVVDVLVIGAGQSGLAIGQQLQERGLSFLIVDAGPETGHVWRSRWDSLTLFTAARYSGLPGLPFPGDPDDHPT